MKPKVSFIEQIKINHKLLEATHDVQGDTVTVDINDNGDDNDDDEGEDDNSSVAPLIPGN